MVRSGWAATLTDSQSLQRDLFISETNSVEEGPRSVIHLGPECSPWGELCSRTRFSLAEIPVLAGSAGAGGMAPSASTRISARMKRVQGRFTRECDVLITGICRLRSRVIRLAAKF